MSPFDGILAMLGRDDVDLPTPVVLADVMQRNIAAMQEFATTHGVALRPHVKTHKCVEIGRLQLDAGAVGITAGTVGEAEVFAEAGFPDIFIAYPLWASGSKPSRIRRLAQAARLRIGTDGPEAIERLAAALGEAVELVEMVVEIDCGAGRSGTRPEHAGALAALARDRGLRPVGVYTYPGHGGADRESRVRAAHDQTVALTAAVRSLASVGVTAEVVSAGSTPTAAYSPGGPVTELRPGEYVFGDLDTVRLGACLPEQVALFVASTVVSDQVPGQVIVDVGTKALGREGNPRKGYGRVASGGTMVDGPELFRLNEYHGYLRMPTSGRLSVGQAVAVIPNHVCPVVNSFDELVVTRTDATEWWTWQVAARGRLR